MTDQQTVSIYQLAENLGVSATTVSRALNHRGGIGAATRERVWAAAREAGYRPKQSVRRMTIGLLLDHADENAMGEFVPRLTTRVIAELAHHDLVLEVFSEGNLDVISQRYVDGFLAIAWQPESIDALRKVGDVPVVIFNRTEYPEFSVVSSDYRQAGEQVAGLLLERGHRKVGFLAMLPDAPCREALGGLRSRYAAAGCEIPQQSIAYTHKQPPYAAAKRLIDQGITALWVCQPELSYEVPYLCSELMGMDLPGDLSLVGMDNAVRHTFSHPPLTVAAENVSTLIDRALEMLMDQLEAKDPAPRRAKVPMDLIVRESILDIR